MLTINVTHGVKPMSASINILNVQSSARSSASQSRGLTKRFIETVSAQAQTEITERDVAQGVPLIDENWVNATFTPEDQRSHDDRSALAFSDVLVQELEDADVVVVGVPLYNFGIPASLKAWFDQVARAGRTFRYTENGPEGLLEGKRAIVVITSGGVPVDSAADFATPHVRQFLSFLGITDITTVAADRLNFAADTSLAAAGDQLSKIAEELVTNAATEAA